jgi:Tfp pilus assembly protein PilX
MGKQRSIRSSSRARTTERGFALAIALILAVLYFGLIELLLIDSSRELAAARRFRAQIVAQTLAENAAEGAALGIADASSAPAPFKRTDEQGEMNGEIARIDKAFIITGTGVSAGLASTRARVELRGTVGGTKIEIHFAKHTQ